MPTKKRLPDAHRRLLDYYERLDERDQHALLSFAAYLAERAEPPIESADKQDVTDLEPKPIPRPDDETVIKAIKRLSATYPMLPKEKMLDRTSALMMEHMLQGRDARSVIDQLESVFELQYRQHMDKPDD